jgi:hypothetical protein
MSAKTIWAIGIAMCVSLAISAVALRMWLTPLLEPSSPRNPPVPDRPSHSDPVLDRVVNSGPMARPRDFFRCITRPIYLTVAEAALSMSPDEVVIGLDIEGDIRSYPINYLNDHEMVQDEIGGTPVLVTW